MPGREMDDIDDLVREASRSHHPVYDDLAWIKMQALLDKHLPIKKDRNRAVLIILLLLFIAGSVFFAIVYRTGLTKELLVAKNQTPASSITKAAAKNHYAIINAATKIPQKNIQISAGFSQSAVQKPTRKIYGRSLSKTSLTINNGSSDNDDSQRLDDLQGPENKKAGIENGIPGSGIGGIEESKKYIITFPGAETNKAPKTGLQISGNTDMTSIIKANLQDTLLKKTTPGKDKQKGFLNNLALTLSAGPDLSYVGMNKPGTTRLNFGAGLAYTFAKKFTIRTGFYFAKKTYGAKATDYHPPKGYWTYNIDLRSVNADCNVYEIPLSLSYQFNRSEKHILFAGIGFSTFLMKRETYNYSYKDMNGVNKNKVWTLFNGNNQFFSVLTVSGGYQYQVNRNFSIAAEPYFKLPVQGIGFGKIKLNSGGLLLTASLKPFAKRK